MLLFVDRGTVPGADRPSVRRVSPHRVKRCSPPDDSDNLPTKRTRLRRSAHFFLARWSATGAGPNLTDPRQSRRRLLRVDVGASRAAGNGAPGSRHLVMTSLLELDDPARELHGQALVGIVQVDRQQLAQALNAVDDGVAVDRELGGRVRCR